MKNLSALKIDHFLEKVPTNHETAIAFQKNLYAIEIDITKKWNP